MPRSKSEESLYISILFMAMSAADRKILTSELFISEKCARDYGIDEAEWDRTMNLAFITYFNDGKEAVTEAIEHLKETMNPDKRKELVEDLLAIALIDNQYHEKERELLEFISSRLEVPCPDPEGLE